MTYILTGITGHLGSAVVDKIKREDPDSTIRCLIFKQTEDISFLKKYSKIEIVYGDIRNEEDVRELFGFENWETTIVIHMAALVEITNVSATEDLTAINVKGANNVFKVSLEKNVRKVVYVNSVHALTAANKKGKDPICEEVRFIPYEVVGGYAETKAIAANSMHNYFRRGLNVSMVQPSGILGPFNSDNNHLVSLIKCYMDKKLPACVSGGYDFVDVRDCADAIYNATYLSTPGQSYILSGHYCSIKNLLTTVRKITNGKRFITIPMWLAEIFAPLFSTIMKKQNGKPLFTSYSLFTLQTNSNFCNDKAKEYLKFNPRPLDETIRDTVEWIKNKKENG